MNLTFVDTEAVKLLLDRYFVAVCNADVPTLKTIFHPDASMNGYWGADLLIGTPQLFFDELLSKPSMASQETDCCAVITEIRVTDNIARATLFVDNYFGTTTLEDYFHLLKIDGEWRILCKTFTTL